MKYQVSNQDHSVMKGVEAVGRILRVTSEHALPGDMKGWTNPGAMVARGAARPS